MGWRVYLLILGIIFIALICGPCAARGMRHLIARPESGSVGICRWRAVHAQLAGDSGPWNQNAGTALSPGRTSVRDAGPPWRQRCANVC